MTTIAVFLAATLAQATSLHAVALAQAASLTGVALAQAASLTGAAPRITIEADAGESFFGSAIAELADLDGDGADELLIGAFARDHGRGAVRRVHGFDGADFAVSGRAAECRGSKPSELFGAALDGVGDLDRDGYADWVVGAPGASGPNGRSGVVRVVSGRDDSTMVELAGEGDSDEFGAAIANAGDFDADGLDDFIVGAPGTSRRGFAMGRATVFSGRNFEPLRIWGGDAGEDRFGSSVANMGDVFGEGHTVVAIGAPQVLTIRPGYVRVYKGCDGLLVGLYGGEQPGDAFGTAIAGVGDLNGDGHGEIAIGAYLSNANGIASGSVTVISIFDGRLLYTWRGEKAGDQFGTSVAPAGDVDGDGVGDVAVGAPQVDRPTSGYVKIFSGKTGAPLVTLRGERIGERFGASLRLVDTRTKSPRLAVGAPWCGGRFALGGRVYLVDPRGP